MALLDDLAAALREEGGLLADALHDAPLPGGAAHGQLAAKGPRACGREAELALVVEAVREGYLLHYGDDDRRPRVVARDDADLALLAGDRLYALGLARLADAGDLESVRQLADVIALCAHAHAADDVELADAVWEAGSVAVGWGPDTALEHAKDAARAGDPGAAASLRAAARQIAGEVAPQHP